MIAERFPDHAVLGEEMGGSAAPPAGPCWVFDPIDGTTNFAHGLPIFCASLALEIDGVAQVAAVYDPTRRELFTAERGGGAFLNGRRLQVSGAAALVDAVLVTGFPYDVHQRVDEIVGLFAAFVGRARAVRRLGSAAIDLCYVAAGRMDGFWESDLKAWDIAGGALIVEQAGGRVTSMSGEPFSSRAGHVLATNGAAARPDAGGDSRLRARSPRADALNATEDSPRQSLPRFPAENPRLGWHLSCFVRAGRPFHARRQWRRP